MPTHVRMTRYYSTQSHQAFALVTYVRPIEISINGTVESWRSEFSTIRHLNKQVITPKNADDDFWTVRVSSRVCTMRVLLKVSVPYSPQASFNYEKQNREDALYSIILIILARDLWLCARPSCFVLTTDLDCRSSRFCSRSQHRSIQPLKHSL